MVGPFGLGPIEIVFLCGLFVVPIVAVLAVVAAASGSRGGKPVTTAPSAPAAWLADPSGRHELRYWNGASWTADVADAGQQGQDPV